MVPVQNLRRDGSGERVQCAIIPGGTLTCIHPLMALLDAVTDYVTNDVTDYVITYR